MVEYNTKRFFKETKEKLDFLNKIEHFYANKLAVKFNLFHFMPWDENKVSEILAFLLDPNADHQQGNLFLALFIKQFELDFPYNETSKIHVEKEHSTLEKRRVDIVIAYDRNKHLIGIENKIYPWTKDQDGQVKDYLAYLSKMSSNGHYQLFYLAPKAKAISFASVGENLEALLAKRKLIMINYEEHLMPLLNTFAIHAENERVRAFIIDFELRLREAFVGNDHLTDHTLMINYIK